jgi:lysozyme family protein
MPGFDNAFAQTVGNEGGYANLPNDPGGETMWGITAAVARANGYQGAMRDMPIYVAKAIYKARYWSPLRCDDLNPSVADDLFDIAVNHGVDTAAKCLQSVVGVKVDGNIGPVTIAAANAKSADKVVMGLISLRITRYTLDKNWSAFGKGWANRAARMLWLQSQEAAQ